MKKQNKQKKMEADLLDKINPNLLNNKKKSRFKNKDLSSTFKNFLRKLKTSLKARQQDQQLKTYFKKETKKEGS